MARVAISGRKTNVAIEEDVKLMMPTEILLKRDKSTIASSWTELLCIYEVGNGKWHIGKYGYFCLGRIFDLVPKEQWYDEDGQLIVPAEWDGHRITGLVDDELLETNELVPADDGIEFTSSTIQLALDYCTENYWEQHSYFEKAWDVVCALVEKNRHEIH